MRLKSPSATAERPVEWTVAPMAAWGSMRVRTEQLYSPASVTTPTRLPVSVMTQSPTSTPEKLPLSRSKVELQLEAPQEMMSASSST